MKLLRGVLQFKCCYFYQCKIILCTIVVAMCDLVHDVKTTCIIYQLLTSAEIFSEI